MTVTAHSQPKAAKGDQPKAKGDGARQNTLGTCNSANADAEYVYDGEGNRVRKIDYNTGAETTYVYDATGRLAAEYSTAASTTPAGSYFRTTDHLGSTRLVTDDSTTPAVVSRYDFFPFGEEIPDTYGARASVTGYGDPAGFDQLFTAKERDAESGLDYFGARYMASAQGRFTSPDPGPYSEGEPQTWNRYTYTRNNPLKYVDPTGEYFVVAPGMQGQVQEYISTMLRTPQGAATVNAIAASNLPVTFDQGRLPVSTGNGVQNVTAGAAVVVPGSPGAVAGINVTLDNSNISTVAKATGKSNFTVGLTAFAHEDQHVTDMLSATSFQGAAAAGAAGDASSRPGAQNTTGGTAEKRAQQTVKALGAAGQKFQPNVQYDAAAATIIQQGAAQAAQQAQKVACVANTPGGPCP